MVVVAAVAPRRLPAVAVAEAAQLPLQVDSEVPHPQQLLQLQYLPFQHPRQVRRPPTPTPEPQRQQQVAAVLVALQPALLQEQQQVDSVVVAVVVPLPQPQAGQLQHREVGAPQQHLRVRR